MRAVRSVTGQPFLEVDAEPAAALNRIREVLLILSDNRDESPAPAPEPSEPSATASEGADENLEPEGLALPELLENEEQNAVADAPDEDTD